MAKWTPASSRPGIGRSRDASAPPASATASYSSTSAAAATSRPTATPQWKTTPSAGHLRDAAIDQRLLELEVGNAVAQQSARLGVLLVDVDFMADARELLGAGEAGRAGADDGDALAGAARRRFGLQPAFAPGAVDDRAFDRLDRHRRVLEVERAGGLARRRADAAGEFGEIVGAVQVARRLLPVVADRPDRSSRGSGCSPDSRCDNRGCRSSCSARPGCASPLR